MSNLTEDQRHQVKFFIQKFEAIPEEQWCVNHASLGVNQHCALGHAGLREGGFGVAHVTPECTVLSNLFKREPHGIPYINDGNNKKYQQRTPKQRVLAALYDLLKI